MLRTYNRVSRWLGRRPSKDALRERLSQASCGVLVRRLDRSREGEVLLYAIAQCHGLECVDEEAQEFRVKVVGAPDPDEAIVRLVSNLDQMDADWRQLLSWPIREKP